tara:strand:- start:47 stop:643 length:597 start_codon:yes stop_codon:yes gene_type:complete
MPYVRGKLKGQLTAPELRRMIKLHNKMVGITIPTGSKRDDLIKIIESNGFKIDHAKQKLIPTSQKMIRKKNVPLPPVKKKGKAKKSEPSIDDEIDKLMKSSDKLDKKSKPKTKKPNIDDEIGSLMKISDELEAKKEEDKWKEFLDIVEANKEILLKKMRPDDKKNKNQYDYYKFKYINRKKEKENPKRMIRLVKNKIK